VFARIGDKVVVVDKHILGERFKISAKGLKEKKRVEKVKSIKNLRKDYVT
jgi:hypothetical protein